MVAFDTDNETLPSHSITPGIWTDDPPSHCGLRSAVGSVSDCRYMSVQIQAL